MLVTLGLNTEVMADYDAIITNNNFHGEVNPFMLFIDKATVLKKPYGLLDDWPWNNEEKYYFTSDAKTV